jgi:hypothetical protein
LDASGTSGLVIDNLSVTQLFPAASTQTLAVFLRVKERRIMRNWLRLIGSGKKPIIDHPFYRNYNWEHVGMIPSERRV